MIGKSSRYENKEKYKELNTNNSTINKNINESRDKKLKQIKNIVFILNAIFLFSNIFLLLSYIQKHQNSYLIFFKNSDFFNINILKKTYQYISNYLLNKYNTKSKIP